MIILEYPAKLIDQKYVQMQTFNISSSSFVINFCNSSTFAINSASLASAASSKLVFSESLTFKFKQLNDTLEPVQYNSKRCSKALRRGNCSTAKDVVIQRAFHSSQHLYKIQVICIVQHKIKENKSLKNSCATTLHTFSCVSSCSIFLFLSRSKDSNLLISSPLVASSQSSASIEL